MMRAMAALLLAGAVVLSGCGPSASPQPVAPSPILVVPSSEPVTIKGTVVEESGGPAINTAITLLNGMARSQTVTDSAGHYEFSIEKGSNFGIRAEKDGYESTYRDSFLPTAPGIFDMRVFRSIRIAAGASVRVAVMRDGSLCGFDDEWFCRTVRVVADHAGTFGVAVAPDGQAPVAAVTINEKYYPPTATATVSAGEEISVQVLLPWNGSGGGVVLSTSLR